MNRRDISARFDGFLRLQVLCLGIILASWLIFWAVNQPITNLRDLFIYVLIQINLSALMLWPLKFLYQDRRSPYHWPVHVVSIFAVTAVVVVTSALAIHRIHSFPMPFFTFLRQSWKFPFVANLVFAFAYEAYKVTTCRLKRHNLELQRTITVEAAEREVEAEELKQAQDIQRGLLPKDIPQLPQFAIAGAWEPARVVGGDYYDVIRLSKDKLAICIADVAGKGVSAALLMANVQAAVRAFASERFPPSRVCSQINSVLYTNTAPEKFVTLFYGVLDARTRTLQYANAGHPRPLIIHSSGKTTRLENGGALLGVFPSWAYEDSLVELEPGDLLLLFTDGITEAVAPGGEEFGEERLIAATTIPNERTLEDLQLHVLGEVKDFCQSQMSDDATLLMIAAAVATPEERNAALIRDKSAKEILQYAGVSS
jgi:sigma-B regulation protein RsbU (phosphoserine phosphatase)